MIEFFFSSLVYLGSLLMVYNIVGFVRFARRIRPYVDGYYLITPFGRTALVGRILEELRRS